MCLASITPNTASTEREFSQFKLFHSPHRNRLSHHAVRKMTIVKQSVMQQYPRSKRKLDEDMPSLSPLRSSLSHSDSTTRSEHDMSNVNSDTFHNTIEDLIECDSGDPPVFAVEELIAASEDKTGVSPVTLRIALQPEIMERKSKMLRYLFPRPDPGMDTASSSILKDFWRVAEKDLSREQDLHDQLLSPELTLNNVA
jgi:hypothetical protein